jgi:osmotically-inducible protein OsmY
MSTATITETDLRLRNAVMRQLDWDPEVDASAIGVSAKGAIVTLTGFVDSYAGKLAAERIVKRVRGVRAVANDVVVRLRVERTDTDIAADAARALGLIPSIAATVQATVHNGYITLTGMVEWLFQVEQAATAVGHVRGVNGIFNHVRVRPRSGERDIQRRIVAAIHHNADVDAKRLRVALDRDVVTLTGTVDTWAQRDAAGYAAGSAPGIIRVINQILVEPAEPSEFEELGDEMC